MERTLPVCNTGVVEAQSREKLISHPRSTTSLFFLILVMAFNLPVAGFPTVHVMQYC